MRCNLIFALALTLFLTPAWATIMQYSFTGEVTGVGNYESTFWQPDDVLGASITGEFLLDTSIELNGRVETSYFWWENIESGVGPLTSQMNIGNQSFLLSNQYDLDPDYEDWTTNEWIEIYNGPDEDGGPIADGYSFSDQEYINYIPSDGEPYSYKYLYIAFFDYINDFLLFPNGFDDGPAPNMVQEFVWTDMDLDSDDEQVSYGAFRYSEGIEGSDVGRVYSELDFVLTEVVATVWTPDDNGAPSDEVPAPATLTIFAGAILFWWLYRRQLHPGFGACSMGGGR